MNKKVGLIILDGIGMGSNVKGNAFKLAKTPTLDKLLSEYPHSQLQASGLAVGLPQGQPGNSEIGHINIGGGRTIRSELVRINQDIENNQFVNNPNFVKLINLAKEKNVKLHVLGLTSYGGVHSNLTHMSRILHECGIKGVNTVIHVIGDGRDVKPGTINDDIKVIEDLVAKYPQNMKIGSISGRYYAMDRDKNWDREAKALDAFMHIGPSFTNPRDYLASNFNNNVTDEFLIPGFNANNPETKLDKNDIVFFINFRQDRTRQMCHLFKKSNLFSQESPAWALNLTLATIVQYDGIDSDIVIFPPEEITNPIGQVLADAGLKQLRIAETEKYAHVTYFMDGGRELSLKGEEKILVPSPKVATYDLKPEMSALEVTDKLLANMDKFDIFICNYANCDMVGHTGKMEPTIKAIETVDSCLAKVLAKAQSLGFTLFITADHGNCDCMEDDKGCVITAHSCAPVFFITTDKGLKLNNGALNNIAPTILKYLGVPVSKEMDKEPLY